MITKEEIAKWATQRRRQLAFAGVEPYYTDYKNDVTASLMKAALEIRAFSTVSA